MACLSERIVDGILLMMSGCAFADVMAIESTEEMTMASIVPPPVMDVRLNPQPQRNLQRATDDQGAHGKAFYAQAEGFYKTRVIHDFSIIGDAGKQPPAAGTQQRTNAFSMSASTGPQLTLVQLSNPASPSDPRVQRRLSLIVDEWTFSGSARVIHDKSATLIVRHGF